MDIKELKLKYENLLINYDEVEETNFTNVISETNSPEAISLHYDTLKNQDNIAFFQSLRGSFDNHGLDGRLFLLDKLDTEKDPILLAEVLFLLGAYPSLKADEKPKLKLLANKFIKEKKSYINEYYGIIVLGWIGGKKEISIIAKELYENLDDELRAYASSSLRQIWERHKRLKDDLLQVYYNSLIDETVYVVNSVSIVCVQDILNKKFGIRESYTGISGDVEKAKPKVLKALEKELNLV